MALPNRSERNGCKVQDRGSPQDREWTWELADGLLLERDEERWARLLRSSFHAELLKWIAISDCFNQDHRDLGEVGHALSVA